MTIKALLFDLDGTLVDSMGLYEQAFNEFLKPYNKTISFTQGQFGGRPVKEILHTIFENNSDIDYEVLTESILSRAQELLTTQPIPFLSGVEEFLTINKDNYIFAICSGSEKTVIEKIITNLEYKEYFKEFISANEVPKGKPAPDIWLEAAKRLQVKPEECIVFEDATAGMIGAKEAGMKVIGIVQGNSEKFPADKIYTSFAEINLREI
jgi:HAD superfamily hydrolase (TIGR01509 family)